MGKILDRCEDADEDLLVEAVVLGGDEISEVGVSEWDFRTRDFAWSPGMRWDREDLNRRLNDAVLEEVGDLKRVVMEKEVEVKELQRLVEVKCAEMKVCEEEREKGVQVACADVSDLKCRLENERKSREESRVKEKEDRAELARQKEAMAKMKRQNE